MLYLSLCCAGLVLSVTACSDNPLAAPETADVYGAWDWVESFDTRGSVFFPALTGFTQRYEFRPTDTLRIYRADTLHAVGPFFFLESEPIGDRLEGVLYLPGPTFAPGIEGPLPDPNPDRYEFTLTPTDTLYLRRNPLTSIVTDITLVRAPS